MISPRGWPALFLLILALASMPSVSKADSKTAPGAICDAVTSSTFLLKSISGEVFTAGSADVDLICPLIREKTGDTPIKEVRIEVLVNLAQDRLVCTVRSVGPALGLIQSKQVATSPRLGPGRQTLTFSNIKTAPRGIVVATCRMPPGSQILSFYWDE